jgi:hypothetical protein
MAWSISIGGLPHFSRDIKLVTKPQIIEEVEATDWVPYTDDGNSIQRLPRISGSHADDL